jgi:hypothetical protein
MNLIRKFPIHTESQLIGHKNSAAGFTVSLGTKIRALQQLII